VQRGTGKTTIINAILTAIEKAHGEGTAFLCLHRQARHHNALEKKQKKQASTIHSLLATTVGGTIIFTFKRSGGLTSKGYSTIIIDESSMVDLGLWPPYSEQSIGIMWKD